jgi:hypothetical protein
MEEGQTSKQEVPTLSQTPINNNNENQTKIKLMKLRGHTKPILCLDHTSACSSIGNLLASGSEVRRVVLKYLIL